VPRDLEVAEKWYRRAAEGGLSEAQNSLGVILQDRRDFADALAWFEKASRQGHAPATYSIGILHDRGRGVPEDQSKAFESYLRAADLGWAEAMRAIAKRYDSDQLGPRDPRAACVWTLRAQRFVRLQQQALQNEVRQAVTDLSGELGPEQFAACAEQGSAWAPQAVWKSEVAPGIFIGQLSGIKRPDGLKMEDARSPRSKETWRLQTYVRNPLTFGRGPQAKFRSNVGDVDLNVGGVELLADKLTERYGHKFNGKKLVVKELSIAYETTVWRAPAGVPVGTLGELFVVMVADIALQSFLGPQDQLRLEVRLEAELDGKRLASADARTVFPKEAFEAPSKSIARVFENALYNLEREEAEAAAQTKPAN
jgi:tetratricopeptide (TPR) repeat protein